MEIRRAADCCRSRSRSCLKHPRRAH
jgi:hypothetical protein